MTGLEAGFRIADAEVRPMEGLVVGAAGRVRIEPKSMAVLVELARHAGEVCSRDQIQQRVWPRGFTTDDVLTRCIGQIRKSLGDNPKNPRHLETIPRRGYRLLQPVTLTEGPAAELPADGPERMIVLPLQYLGSDDGDYLADGMTELLTARLVPLNDFGLYRLDTQATVAAGAWGQLKVEGLLDFATGRARWLAEGQVCTS